jgi:hypothetical protein
MFYKEEIIAASLLIGGALLMVPTDWLGWRPAWARMGGLMTTVGIAIPSFMLLRRYRQHRRAGGTPA